jgi:hypothetical protein
MKKSTSAQFKCKTCGDQDFGNASDRFMNLKQELKKQPVFR